MFPLHFQWIIPFLTSLQISNAGNSWPVALQLNIMKALLEGPLIFRVTVFSPILHTYIIPGVLPFVYHQIGGKIFYKSKGCDDGGTKPTSKNARDM
jgi:hypothetical protein